MDDNVQNTNDSGTENQPVQQDQQQTPKPEKPDEVSKIPADDRNMGLLCHLLGIFTWWLGPLILWLVKKDHSEFVKDQGKESLNWQITVAIITAICIPFTLVVIGVLGIMVVQVLNIIFCILGTLEASKGKYYRYPFAIRLLK
jgi:hypothetical protein